MANFTYGIGASWVFQFEHRPMADGRRISRQFRYVRYTITDATLRGRTEYYTVALEEEGKPVCFVEQTASRLRYLINFNLVEALSMGTPKEYPLTAYEVAEWYRAQTTARALEYARALQMLKGHRAYAEITAQQKHTEIAAARAEAECKFEKATALNRQVRELAEALAKIRGELGITDDILTPRYRCPICKDTGLTADGCVCACAKEHEAEIRAYVAREVGA